MSDKSRMIYVKISTVMTHWSNGQSVAMHTSFDQRSSLAQFHAVSGPLCKKLFNPYLRRETFSSR